jgi:hypothetical protein
MSFSMIRLYAVTCYPILYVEVAALRILIENIEKRVSDIGF